MLHQTNHILIMYDVKRSTNNKGEKYRIITNGVNVEIFVCLIIHALSNLSFILFLVNVFKFAILIFLP